MTTKESFHDLEQRASALYMYLYSQTDEEERETDYLADKVLPRLVEVVVALRCPKTIGDLLAWETDPLKWAGLEYLVNREVPSFRAFADVWEWHDLLLTPEHASFDGKAIAKFIHDYIEKEEWGPDETEVTGK